MAKWSVKKFVKVGGRCPIDEWLQSKKVTAGDRGSLDAVVQALEATGTNAMFPPEKLKKYKTTDLYEVKVRAPGGKQLRPLAAVDDIKKEVVLLCGAIKQNATIDNSIEQGTNLFKAWKANNGSVKSYWED